LWCGAPQDAIITVDFNKLLHGLLSSILDDDPEKFVSLPAGRQVCRLLRLSRIRRVEIKLKKLCAVNPQNV